MEPGIGGELLIYANTAEETIVLHLPGGLAVALLIADLLILNHKVALEARPACDEAGAARIHQAIQESRRKSDEVLAAALDTNEREPIGAAAPSKEAIA
jgi:hypothetical protein